HAANATPGARTTSATAPAMSHRARMIASLQRRLEPYGVLAPVRATGTVNVLAWQASTDALLIDAAFVSVTVRVPEAGTVQLPDWSAKVTPLDASHVPSPDAIDPIPLMICVTSTLYGFELLIFTFTSAEPFG